MRTRMRLALLVDSDPGALIVLASVASVKACGDFQTARGLLFEHEPDRLITNLRLSAFNGLHLVYLAAPCHVSTRRIVYAAQHSVALGRDVQAAGAFHEWQERLPFAIAS